MLQKILSEKINIWQKEIHSVIKNKGQKVISEVTVSQAYGGMRGVKGLTCETSAVSADRGLIIRGYPLTDISHISPEEVFYLLLTGELPDSDAVNDIQDQLKNNQKVPEYVWKILESMPKHSHPMTMLTTAIQSMQVDSIFVKKYNAGTPKTDLWKWTLDDGITLLSAIPGIAAGIYRMRYNKGDRIEPDKTLDWAGNFAHMLGIQDEDFKKLMRLYLMLHCDHEGGNVSAFSSLTVASALSSPFLSVAAGLNGLAGPLHGLANQECLKFVLDVKDHFKTVPSDEDLKDFCW
ncbi:MAG: citrate (Si)-synthase, partial [Candidatus Marinimicrobia bacterium]|nr:citrate (Si)-synthase [Candidatus Neomarinimicrobiota bacterium]